MTVDPTVIPGLLLLVAELVVLAAVGYAVVRVALRQTDDRAALAQGLMVGPALWGLLANFIMYVVPGLAAAAVAWALVIAVAAALAWRFPDRLQAKPRTVAAFAVAVLAICWVALASRQFLSIPDAINHLGLAASIRAGGFPPVFFWTPDLPASYHHGTGLLIGLLAPPVGPDLALTTEILDVWLWTGFFLVVVTALLRYASKFAVLLTAPLLFTAGAWTFIGDAVDIVQVPLPAGIPAAGIRASLTEVYWPVVELPWASERAALPDIWRFVYTLSYALAFVVLEHAARPERRTWPATLTLAALVGFVGLLATTLAPILLVLWGGLEVVALVRSRGDRTALGNAALRSGAGPVLALLLLALGGGSLASALTGSGSSGLSFGWADHPGFYRPLGALDVLDGGVGLLRGGPVVIAGIAALLAWRSRLVLALAVGVGLLVLAGVALRYDPAPWVLSRFFGHARNLALLALLLALAPCLSRLPSPRWRYAAAVLLIVLVAWPTLVAPVRNLGLAIGQGVALANAAPTHGPPDAAFAGHGRFAMPAMSGRVAAYAWDHTAVDARVFSPTPADLSFAAVAFATGRPNASGFLDRQYFLSHTGPAYLDVLRHLEPAAVRRLELDYIHATDDWVAGLPERAARWLADPNLFELLIRDGAEALYRIRPAFLNLDVAPAPTSFEALRRAVPPDATVYMPAPFRTVPALRVAATLSHARLLGFVDPTMMHLLTPWPYERFAGQAADLVILWPEVEPWMFPPAGRQPIWWNDEIAVYAPDGAVAPIMPPPPASEPAPVAVRVTDVRAADGRIAFTATFDNRAPDRWTGQEWVVLLGDRSPWAIPMHVDPGGRTLGSVAWFPGQLAPSTTTNTFVYEFDILAPSLAVRDANGTFTPAGGSAQALGAGAWTLAVRLQHEWQPNYWRHAGLIPVLRIRVSDAGEIAYDVFDDVVGGSRP
ncbi:MAG: hypothetical protein OXU21_03145 [Chloroflexota bacterium]|nr:hypothetical protein [Chloroflexota bacterium]